MSEKERALEESEKQRIDETFRRGSENFSEADLKNVLADEKTAKDKAKNHLSHYWGEFQLLWDMLVDYRAGRYRAVPWKFVASVGFAVVYLISPLDVIPDFLPIIGFVDDSAVFGLVLAGFKADIEAYRDWKNAQK